MRTAGAAQQEGEGVRAVGRRGRVEVSGGELELGEARRGEGKERRGRDGG